MTQAKYIPFQTREARDMRFAALFANRDGCKKFDVSPRDDYHEDGAFELTALREGFHIEVPYRLAAAYDRACAVARADKARYGKWSPEKAAMFNRLLDEAESQ